jgi:ribosomal protein S18 acetylase RimI-like enzyme
MPETRILGIDENNISEYPPVCFLNPKNEGYVLKRDWLKKRFSEGLKIKALYSEKEKKSIGFIEYAPGETAWRAVDAPGYLFIHCIWVTPNKYKNKGYGSLLLDECVKEAKEAGKYGVAAVTSEGSFMAGIDLFKKNGFASVAHAKPSFELMVKSLKKGPLPNFKETEKRLAGYKGLNIVYSNQCPWVARSIPELEETAKKKGVKLKVTELKTPKEAQNAPAIYASFSLIWNGKLLADHYISTTRFQNILNKELK